MKVLCIIDSFGSGGAQRQMVTLACALKEHGHVIQFFTYFPQYNFFRSLIEESRIPIHDFKKGRGFSFGLLLRLYALQQKENFDIVLSFLNTSNIYAELIRLISKNSMLVVSERSSQHDDRSLISAFLRRLLHLSSNRVVANSRSHTEFLKKKWRLSHVSTIYNGFKLDSFSSEPIIPNKPKHIRLLAIGTVGPIKNPIKLIQGLDVFYKEFGYVPEVNWVGKRDSSPAGEIYCQQVDDLLNCLPNIQKRWHWLGEQSDIPQLFRLHHALIHPSIYEGLPNVVCEALAAGKPILISNVCEHPFLVRENERGFLFDPNNSKSIADAIKKLSDFSAEDWIRYSSNARQFAVENLGVEKMVKAYETLFSKLISGSVVN
jgi:glycosyltransferase involved in cell wall biosynthesis